MKKLIQLLFITYSVTLFSQSPWTQKKDKFYTQLSFTTISDYNTLFGNPDYFNYGNYTDNTFQFYSEYGLNNKTTLILNIPLKNIAIKGFEDPRIQCINNCSEDFNKTALGNIEIGIKRNFIDKNWLLSGQLTLEANTSSYQFNSGIRTGYNAWTLTPMLLTGKSFGKTYVQSFIGANIRTNNYSSNFKIGGEVGHKIINNIWLVGFVDVVKSFKNGAVVLPIENTFTGLYVNDQEYGAYGLKTIGEFSNKFGITASFASAFFGNNVPKKAALNFGVYHKF